MRKFVTMVVGAHLVLTPALSHAASLEDGASQQARSRVGAFAGARLRLKLGGKDEDRARAGMTVAPFRTSWRADGARVFRIGEGLELGFSSKRPPGLAIAGQRIDRRFGASDDKDGGVPTWVIITGGVVLALGIGAAVLVDRIEDSSD